ncbi:hypothetical protein VN97_g10517 [Penicillium thymicola]|uniref:Uncharacterized protein n=1 Tax=Penicillium thymicola TaxID=293382 RepID=A0AAI9X3V6_PENTH|nr:hypothetical protein VN97_g10517 [Penicillium thymicola]
MVANLPLLVCYKSQARKTPSYSNNEALVFRKRGETSPESSPHWTTYLFGITVVVWGLIRASKYATRHITLSLVTTSPFSSLPPSCLTTLSTIQFNSDSVQIQFRSNSFSVQIQFRFNSL